MKIFADIAFGSTLTLLHLFFKSNHHLSQILYLALFISYFLVELSMVEHLGSFHTGLHAFH